MPHHRWKEHMLEEIIPEEEIVMAKQVVQTMRESENLREEERALLRELFDSLGVAHTEIDLPSMP